MPLTAGQILNNRYRIVKLLGQGGFGSVYRAWDLNLGRPCALKENLDTTPEAQRQFKREARLLADLSHPNLPRVTDHFIIPGQGQYLVMDFVEGNDLQQMLDERGGPLPEAQALEWISQICNALAYLHSQQPPVIHRDIKPANIKITADGRAMLVDFGIAKIYDPKLSTTVGARAVTPGYSPQEQYGQGATDHRTDVYALGATLYHLLTYIQPPESILRNLDAELTPPRALNPAISANTENAVLKAMEMHPGRRFQSAVAFKTALAASPKHIGAPATPETAVIQTMPMADGFHAEQAVVPSYPSGPVSQAAEPRGRPWWMWAGLAGGALLMLGCLAVALAVIYPRLSASQATEPAEVAVAFITNTRLPTSTFSVRASPTHTRQLTATRKPSSTPTRTRRPPSDTPRPQPPTNTPKPSGPPILEMDKNYMCRGGPGPQYVELWTFKAGERKEILGKSGDGWYLIKIDDPRTRKKQCWVGGGIVDGDISKIPISNWTGDGY